MQIDEDTFNIFNCLTIADAKLSSEKLNFDETSIKDKVVFKTQEQQCIDVYCTERLKNAIEEFELKGAIFDEKLNSY